jgi:hypothetical protein
MKFTAKKLKSCNSLLICSLQLCYKEHCSLEFVGPETTVLCPEKAGFCEHGNEHCY